MQWAMLGYFLVLQKLPENWSTKFYKLHFTGYVVQAAMQT